MRLKAALAHLQQAHCDIGAMVRYPFIIGGDIRKHKAQLYRTLSLPQPLYMALLDFIVELVDNLLKRFYKLCPFQIFCLEGIDRKLQYLADRSGKHFYFLRRLI